MYYIKKIKLVEQKKNDTETKNNYNKLISDNNKIDLFFKILIIILFFGVVSILLAIGDNLLKFAPLEFWVVSFIFACLILLYFINKG